MRQVELFAWRWVVARTFARLGRSRRLSHDYERLAATLVSLRFLAFACLLLRRFTGLRWSH